MKKKSIPFLDVYTMFFFIFSIVLFVQYFRTQKLFMLISFLVVSIVTIILLFELRKVLKNKKFGKK